MYLSSMSVCEPLGEVVWGVAEILGFPGGERLIGQLPSDQVESVTWRPVGVGDEAVGLVGFLHLILMRLA